MSYNGLKSCAEGALAAVVEGDVRAAQRHRNESLSAGLAIKRSTAHENHRAAVATQGLRVYVVNGDGHGGIFEEVAKSLKKRITVRIIHP